jgi:hypothetical protein
MADVITRLKVESTEYDSKIKRASQGLLQMEQACRKVGGTLAILEKDELEFVKGLGKMETVSKDARGQLSELTKAFTDLSLQYKRLADEEKQGDFGKALASSLGELKTRIQDTKGQLDEINGEINGGGGLTGALDSLAGKFGLSVEQLTKFGGVAGIAAGALKVAKDAFLQSEPNIDSWEGTVKGAETAYNQLLTQLNQGSWDNFFKNITDAYNAGVALYGVLDKMGSVKANNEFAISQNEADLAGLRAQLRKAQNEGDTAAADTIKKQMAAVEETIKSLKGEIEKATYDAGRSTVETILNSSYKATTGRAMNMASIDAIIEDLGKRGQAVFTEAEKTYKELRKKGTYTNYTTVGSSITGYAMSGGGESFDLNRLTPEEQRLYARALAIMNSETNLQPALALLNDSARQRQETFNQEYQVNRWIGSGGGSGGGSGSSVEKQQKEQTILQSTQREIAKLTEEALTADEGRLEVIRQEIAALQHQVNVYKQIQEYAQGGREKWNIQVGDRKAFETEQRKRFEENTETPSRLQVMEASLMKEMRVEDVKVDTATLNTLIKDALQSGIDTTSLDLTTIADQIGEGINVPDEKWQEILDKYNELREAIGEEPIQINFNTGNMAEDGKKSDKAWTDAARAVKSVGSALSQIENPVANVMGIVAQAIATVALTFASSLKGTVTPWDWIAAAAAGTATMIGTIAAIKSATKGYAEGGIVQGNSYSGDNVGPVMLDAGELILNRSQQSTVASALLDADNARGGYTGVPYTTGEKIVMGINNYGRRAGFGELVFSKK